MFISKLRFPSYLRSALSHHRSFQIGEPIACQSSRVRCRSRINSFSTAVARESSPIEETEEDLPSGKSSSHKSSERTGTASRPRLEALRQQLDIDGIDRNVWVQQTRSSKHLNGGNDKPTIPSGKGCSSSSLSYQDGQGTLESDVAALEELIRHIESLPEPKGSQYQQQQMRGTRRHPLTDRFGREHSYLRISLAERCSLRCLYCMPEHGVPLQPTSHLLSSEEIIRLTGWFVEQGVSKVRLTGGEPLLRKDIIPLIDEMNTKYGSSLEQIGMTTNGVSLSKSKLLDLIAAGLTHVNLSLDSLDAETFATLTRRPIGYHTKVMRALEDCATLLPHRTKVNVVVMPSNVHEMIDFVRLTLDMPIDVRFIEYMPFNDNKWTTSDGFVSYEQMMQRLNNDLLSNKEEHSGQNTMGSSNDFILERLQDGPNDTTKWWRLSSYTTSDATNREHAKALGRVGFITSMSEHFCSTCNRLRLTADGKLKVCLFGKTEVSLRDLLRRGNTHIDSPDSTIPGDYDEQLLQKVIHYAVQQKHYKLGGHADMHDLSNHSTENRPMTLIGG